MCVIFGISCSRTCTFLSYHSHWRRGGYRTDSCIYKEERGIELLLLLTMSCATTAAAIINQHCAKVHVVCLLVFSHQPPIDLRIKHSWILPQCIICVHSIYYVDVTCYTSQLVRLLLGLLWSGGWWESASYSGCHLVPLLYFKFLVAFFLTNSYTDQDDSVLSPSEQERKDSIIEILPSLPRRWKSKDGKWNP